METTTYLTESDVENASYEQTQLLGATVTEITRKAEINTQGWSQTHLFQLLGHLEPAALTALLTPDVIPDHTIRNALQGWQQRQQLASHTDMHDAQQRAHESQQLGTLLWQTFDGRQDRKERLQTIIAACTPECSIALASHFATSHQIAFSPVQKELIQMPPATEQREASAHQTLDRISRIVQTITHAAHTDRVDNSRLARSLHALHQVMFVFSGLYQQVGSSEAFAYLRKKARAIELPYYFIQQDISPDGTDGGIVSAAESVRRSIRHGTLPPDDLTLLLSLLHPSMQEQMKQLIERPHPYLSPPLGMDVLVWGNYTRNRLWSNTPDLHEITLAGNAHESRYTSFPEVKFDETPPWGIRGDIALIQRYLLPTIFRFMTGQNDFASPVYACPEDPNEITLHPWEVSIMKNVAHYTVSPTDNPNHFVIEVDPISGMRQTYSVTVGGPEILCYWQRERLDFELVYSEDQDQILLPGHEAAIVGANIAEEFHTFHKENPLKHIAIKTLTIDFLNNTLGVEIT